MRLLYSIASDEKWVGPGKEANDGRSCKNAHDHPLRGPNQTSQGQSESSSQNVWDLSQMSETVKQSYAKDAQQ